MKTKILTEGLAFGEGPRWHDGKLWFSDMHARWVTTVDPGGRTERIVEVPNLPSGLGWLPDGRLIVVSMRDRQLLRLEGKKLAISPGNSHQILWPVYEKLSGLKPGSVSWVTMDAASMPPALIRGAVDAVPFFVVHEARIRKIAKQQNTDIRVLAAWADLGFDVASTSLVAREDTIAKDPEGLKAFLRATLKGADYAFRDKHWDEGVGYVVKAHPEVDPDGALGAAQVGARFVYASEVTSGKMAVGQFDPVQLEKTRDLYTQYLELKRKVGLGEIYTNDLLPARK